MTNDNENRVAIRFWATVSVSDELWDELWEEDNDNAVRKIADKYGFILMTDKEAETVPEGTPVIAGMEDPDSWEEFYSA